MGRLVAQFKIMARPVINSLSPSLFRLGLVLLGVLIGLFWGYQNVKFYDGSPAQLAEGHQDEWIKMTATRLSENPAQNTTWAKDRVREGGITIADVDQLITDNPNDATLVAQLTTLRQVIASDSALQKEAEDNAKEYEPSTLSNILGPLTCIGGTLIIGIILAFIFTFYWAVPVGKWSKGAGAARAAATSGVASSTHAARQAAQRAVADQKTDFVAVGETPPVSQYMSTYILGDDLYDDSFSIETASGEFLGECGSGISETIGVGDPKKVTATEVWLFDKNDIRTVTKVLMTEHAFNDQALRTKLAPKGEAVLATAGGVTMLETQTLRVRVRIVDLQYGEGSLPPKSFLERLTVEIAAWPKEGSASGGDAGKPQSAAFGDTAELLNY